MGGTTGIQLSDITFGANWVRFDIDNGANWTLGSFAEITLEVRHNVPDGGATFGLFAASLMAISALRRRK